MTGGRLLLLWLLGASTALAACDDGSSATASGDDAAPPAPDGGDADGAKPAADARPDDAGPMPDAEADAAPPDDRALLLGVPEGEAWTLEGLTDEVHVIRTEAGVPHIYATNRLDLARVLGFVVARDRYFVMDLQRRLGLGTLSALLGDAALENDLEARGSGMTHVADRLLQNLSPEMSAYLDAFAGGINAYIEQVRVGALPAPSELELARAFLGADRPVDLMQPWDRRSLAAMVAVVLYETNFETDDVGRTAATQRYEALSWEGPFADLRREGYRRDIWEDARPIFEASSAAGLGLETEEGLQGPRKRGHARAGARWRPRRPAIPRRVLDRLTERLRRFAVRINRDRMAGFGSNAWAVAGKASATGGALVAGDGHLQLSVPALMYQIGLDTSVLGGGDTHQAGLLLTGLPLLAVGTNGRVAWSQVNPVVDIIDWYREEIRLGADGRPEATRFRGEWRPLVAVDEVYEIADVPILGSEGRTETWTRWTTFDGRFLVEIEGREATPDDELAEGEALVNMMGQRVVPQDLDGDGVIAGVSFDYGAFDATGWIDGLDRFGHAADIHALREATRYLVGGGLFTAAADARGNILYSSYQAIPCRTYLARDEDGRWQPGADPTLILDGTVYGGFTLPTRDGAVDETPGQADPYQCVIPFDAMPQALNPAPGYVFTANNDPGRLTWDGALHDDAWYLGGPWSSVRAHTIARELARAVEEGTADEARMAEIQANNVSRTGELFAAHLVEAITAARSLAGRDDLEDHERRLADVYAAEAAAFDEVAARLERWAELGHVTPSGVATFYHRPTEADREASVATMVFNAWLPRVLRAVFDDEGLDGAWRFSRSRQQVRALRRFLEGRGPDNPLELASWHAATGESIFFDVHGTEPVERSREVMLRALADALAFLRSEPAGPGEGGFGTPDMSAWLWGLRHQTRFESLLGDFLSDDPAFGVLVDRFSITTRTLPLAEGIGRDDPRRGLEWFPRGGDQWGVDAANPGFSGTRFTHGNGPVMRMVIELRDGRVRGRNIIPGGQSALTDSPHFADQAALWLANEALPLRFHPADVAAGATTREVYGP